MSAEIPRCAWNDNRLRITRHSLLITLHFTIGILIPFFFANSIASG
jgi:hypothetical protein